MRPFLTGRWSNLCLFTYPVPEELLLPRLAPGLELDRHDGKAFVSLVAFDFTDTRVMGIAWPGFRGFPEINLRFYVRRGNDRGVMFIREFVPQRMVAWMARQIYNEPYLAASMYSKVTQQADAVTVEHRLTFAGRTHTMYIAGNRPAFRPAENSTEHFFKEHRWGYGVTAGGRPIRYEVVHPVWDCYPIRGFQLDLDWAAVYGDEWSVLQGVRPYSIMLATGSEITVQRAEILPEVTAIAR